MSVERSKSRNKERITSKRPEIVTARDWSKLPPTEFVSTFTLQQKDSIGTNFNSQAPRFPEYNQGS